MRFEFSDGNGYFTTVKHSLTDARDYARRMVKGRHHVDIFLQEPVADIQRTYPDVTMLRWSYRLRFIERVVC